MEFENYERELKYLIKKNEKYTSKQFLEFLYENYSIEKVDFSQVEIEEDFDDRDLQRNEAYLDRT